MNFTNITISADGYYTLGTRNYLTSPLPITLLDFNGELTEKGVELSWTTAVEKNNDHFIIQRSVDGENFTTLTKVKASGDSESSVSYTEFDPSPFPDRTYYRLQQSDYDGRITNLKTIAVATSERRNTIEVIPNPSNGTFWFELPVGALSGEIKVLNTGGQEMPFSVSFEGTRMHVDAQSLPKGLYLLKLVSDRGMHSAKFIIE